jgi:3',5'-cyclic-AMP phosphodiesterase
VAHRPAAPVKLQPVRDLAQTIPFAWITDPHLNHCSLAAWDRLVGQVRASGCEGVVISGDISEGEDVVFQLRRMADAFAVPLYFVLGNHDFYHSSRERTLAAVRSAVASDSRLHYLTDSPPIAIAPSVAMVGEDGWGDASAGDYARSPVKLNDFRLIDDFALTAPALWRSVLTQWGQQSAQRLKAKLDVALASYPNILVVTHVPPFREACWYQGQTTDDDWAPFFVCGQCGDVLIEAATHWPKANLQVICGHTHHGGIANLRQNLTVTTAGADYGRPAVSTVIEIKGGNILIRDRREAFPNAF